MALLLSGPCRLHAWQCLPCSGWEQGASTLDNSSLCYAMLACCCCAAGRILQTRLTRPRPRHPRIQEPARWGLPFCSPPSHRRGRPCRTSLVSRRPILVFYLRQAPGRFWSGLALQLQRPVFGYVPALHGKWQALVTAVGPATPTCRRAIHFRSAADVGGRGRGSHHPQQCGQPPPGSAGTRPPRAAAAGAALAAGRTLRSRQQCSAVRLQGWISSVASRGCSCRGGGRSAERANQPLQR